ncbi:hypothetical protein OH76DRAFT_1483886 [Lentinus brumalis]|uniref:F-box domain-containing protein n=1 Tax=Lentinus brumalis TaxID=2498619 RepID=A0A371D7M9_9APHY|nr:hypothetical protein OH76DRAFT_1483886 [Polyporus brumalis]
MVSCLSFPILRYKERGKGFRRRQQREPRPLELVPYISSLDSTYGSSTLLQLPVELWLEVIRHMTDADALAQLNRVNSTFHAATEPALYRNVHLESDTVIVKFSQSLLRNPRRSRLVHALTVSTLILIPHSLATRLEPLPHWGVKGCTAVLSVDYPSLRTFTSNLSERVVTPFLERHTNIEEVHLVGHPSLFSTTWAPQGTTSHKLNFHSLRSLTCPHRFLHGALNLPPTLTHLHVLPLSSNLLFLPSPSAAFGSRLVSLRVRLSIYSLWGPQALRQVTLNDVVATFPSLKYLQVDVNYTSDPHDLRTTTLSGLHWTAKCEPDRYTEAAQRLTVAWIFSYPRDQGVNMVKAARWHQSLKEVALEVLLEWEHLVERVIFRHTIIPYVSVALNESRTGLVCWQERGMTDEYWNTV